MNTKTTKFLLPAFAAVFALMFVAAAPHVMAEPGEGKTWTGGERDGDYNHAKMAHKGHMAMTVEGFTGSIPVSDMSNMEDKKAAYEELKSQVTVRLSEAAAAAEDAGLDVSKAELTKVVNENEEKFIVWKLVEKNQNSDSDMVTKTIFVVDAGDIANTTTVTKEYDSSMKDENRHSYGKDHTNTLSDPEKIEDKIAKIEQKINEGNLSPEQSETKVQFVYLLRQLQTAVSDGNDAQADSLREQLQELRNQMIDLKKFR